MTRLVVLLSSLSLIGAGCAVRGPLLRHDDDVASRSSQLRLGEGRAARLAQQGTRVQVEAIQLCDRVERLHIERTHLYARRTKNKTVTVATAVGSALGIALGTVALVRAPSLPASRDPLDDGFTRSQARGGGAAAVALGSAAAFGLLIHGIRIARGDREREQVTEDGEVLEREVACPAPVPWTAAPVTLGARVALGQTGADGRAELDLAPRVPPAAIEGAPLRVDLRVGGRPVGQVDLAPVRHAHQEDAWRFAGAMRCAAPEEPDDCDGVAEYLRRYPEGPHADEARRTLERARGALAEAAARRRAEAAAAAEALRRANAERAAELQRQAEESARRLREEEQARERAARQRERELRAAEERQRDAQRQAEREAQRRRVRRECQATCRQSCGGVQACVTACYREQCG